MRIRQFILALTAVGGLGFAPSFALADGGPLFAVLNGGNEVDTGGQANKGDLEATGSATVMIVGKKKICFGIVISGTDKPILAHIHSGKSGVAGPIVVLLSPPKTGTGASSGCVANVDPETVSAIQAMPADFYVNVHTTAFPSGAIRGQLF
jgi:hypothetical protein